MHAARAVSDGRQPSIGIPDRYGECSLAQAVGRQVPPAAPQQKKTNRKLPTADAVSNGMRLSSRLDDI